MRDERNLLLNDRTCELHSRLNECDIIFGVTQKVSPHAAQTHVTRCNVSLNKALCMRCRLCRLFVSALTPAHRRIQRIGYRTSHYIKEQHGKEPDNIEKNFKILRKCQSKLDCLIFEMLFIRRLKPKLNKQSDSLRAKLFV